MYFKLSTCIVVFVSFFSGNYSSYEDKFINEFVVQIPGGFSEAISVAKQMGFIMDHKMIGFDDLFVLKYKRKVNNVHRFYQHRVKRSTKVTFIEQQFAKKRVKRAPIPAAKAVLFTDPMYHKQWYLIRSLDQPEQADMNVIEAWRLGYSGKGVVVSILDDGIDYRHPDLKDNYDSNASYDINGKDNDPLPNFYVSDNSHGTRCAGEVAAKANNSVCGVGIAFNSRIGAVRMLDGVVTDRVEAEALSLRQQYIDIYSGSWGPDDNGQKVEGPARLAKQAFENGVTKGRGGLGNIFVWASGNGGKKYDSCACDGYASSIYTLSVSSVSEMNRKPWFLESCASTLISTYSSGEIYDKKIISTDLNNQCTNEHTGTSASAPLAAGIIALLLEANAYLTWRDVQYISVVTANPRPFMDGDFITNGANRKVSNLYGFGLMDSGKMVRLGLLWQTLPPQHICKSKSKVINSSLSGEFVKKITLNVDGCAGESVVNYVEHVILHLTVNYQKRGDLQVYIISPMGTRSEILPYRPLDYHSGSATFDKWPLMSVQFWGESALGAWSVELRNLKSNDKVMKGFLTSFSLEIYGTEKFPIRLNPPTTNETDGWFYQFQQYVVEKSDVDNIVQNAYPRDYFKPNTNTAEIREIKCHNQCFNNTCNGWGPQHCMSCNKYKTHDGICVDLCGPGTYLNVSSSTCESCHYSCAQCTGSGKNQCSRCYVGDTLNITNNQCHMYDIACIAGNNSGNSTCLKCPSNCSTCNYKTSQCSQCQPGFVLTVNYQCKLACDLGSYADLSWYQCRVCHINCLSCVNGNSHECTSCAHDSVLLPVINGYSYGTCLSQCQPSYFTNQTLRQCYRCHQNCKNCTGPFAHQCLDCIPPLIMSNNTQSCTDPVLYNCKPDEFKSSNGTCEKCSSHCQSCSNGKCTVCGGLKRYFHNHDCVEKCPSDHFSLSNDNVCLPCKSFCDPCKKNDSLSECSACLPIVCDQQCKKGEYWNSTATSCKTCHSSCSTCIGGSLNDCMTCAQPTHVLSSHKCLKQCSIKERLLLRDNLTYCIPCHPECKDLSCDTNTGKCLACTDGHRLSSDGRCERIITCPMSSYYSVIDVLCKPCHKSCRSCHDHSNCESCPTNHCLDSRYSTCHSCCSPFSSNKNCFKCVAGKEFCDIPDFPLDYHILFRYYKFVGLSVSLVTFVGLIIIMRFLYKKNVIKEIKIRFRREFPAKYSVLHDNSDDDGTVLLNSSHELSIAPFCDNGRGMEMTSLVNIGSQQITDI